MVDSKTSVGNVEAVDIGVIVAYFVLVMGFGLWIGASLFASNIGSGHFIGLAGSGASTGIGIAAFELNAIFILLILGWIFVPVYISSGVYTMPEYIQKRFGGQRIRIYLAVLALLLSIFTKVAADLYAGAVFINQAMDLNIYIAIIILLAVAALFTIAGGLTAVIWTDFIQTIVMIIGAFYLMIVGFIQVGGYEVIRRQYHVAASNTSTLRRGLEPNQSCGYPPQNSFHLMREASDPGLPWTGVIFGLTVSSVWYWCSDQVIVQRALASKDYSHAKAGCILAGYLKFLPMWLIVLPGMISRILYPDEIACSSPEVCEAVCGSSAGCTNVAYPLLVIKLLPAGARGLMLAVMMSALMSSLTSIFNSSSTIFTVDIWTRIRSSASDTELMIVSRVFVLVMVGLGIAWIPIVQNFSELFNYIQSVTSYLSPPICAVYVLAVLWKRTNEQGAFWGLMVGLVIGVVRFAWESAYKQPNCGEPDDRPSVISDVHYLHFGLLLFGIVLIVVIVISLLTKPIEDKYLVRMTFWDRHNKSEREEIPESYSDNCCIRCSKVKPKDHNTPVKAESSPSATAQDEGTSSAKLPWWRVAINWICGIEAHPEMELSEEEMKELKTKQTSLEELPLNKKLCTANALILMTLTIFFWGFFA